MPKWIHQLRCSVDVGWAEKPSMEATPGSFAAAAQPTLFPPLDNVLRASKVMPLP
ncbi:hypothetical protein [Legionella saoudiensis]|uniref:hypothetical protein n=1 Tax=Legionella saoudiensis TaxID=1750561 RepID=UPI0012D7C586|nr:hypothetical protein [Legionella saoudiensis]